MRRPTLQITFHTNWTCNLVAASLLSALTKYPTNLSESERFETRVFTQEKLETAKRIFYHIEKNTHWKNFKLLRTLQFSREVRELCRELWCELAWGVRSFQICNEMACHGMACRFHIYTQLATGFRQDAFSITIGTRLNTTITIHGLRFMNAQRRN